MAPRRKIKRNIKLPGKETPAQRQMRTAVRVIMDNPHYNSILAAIRSGAPNSSIAEWAISRGILDVNQKTAIGYLQYFRKAEPALCKPNKDKSGSDGVVPLDNLFDGSTLVIHEETELLRLIALQKARLGIAFHNEKQLNMLIQSNRREVEELRNLIVDLAKLRGLIGNTLDVNVKGYQPNVVDDLKGIQQDEQQRGMIASLVADLVTEACDG